MRLFGFLNPIYCVLYCTSLGFSIPRQKIRFAKHQVLSLSFYWTNVDVTCLGDTKGEVG